MDRSATSTPSTLLNWKQLCGLPSVFSCPGPRMTTSSRFPVAPRKAMLRSGSGVLAPGTRSWVMRYSPAASTIVCPDFMDRTACSSSVAVFTCTTSPSGAGKGVAAFCSSSALATSGGVSARRRLPVIRNATVKVTRPPGACSKGADFENREIMFWVGCRGLDSRVECGA